MKKTLKNLGYLIALPFLCIIFLIGWALADQKTKAEIEWKVNQLEKERRLRK